VSWPPCAVRIARIAALLGISLSANSAPAPTTGELAHCAGIAGPDARLACYDTLAGRAADRAVPAAAPTPTSAATPTAAAMPTAAVVATTPPTAPASPAAPAPTAASDARDFGFTRAQLHATAVGPAAIEARIARIIDNRAGRAYVVLDNGQTWAFTDADEDARLGPGDPVTIQRGSLGSFLMVTQAKRSYHVRRTH
jgi:hypothetical protein